MASVYDDLPVEWQDALSGPADTLDEQLGYDADHSDPSQYCRHGTFIGSWWGPDILCGLCESGLDPCEGCGRLVGGEDYIDHEREEARGYCRIPVRGHVYCDDCLAKVHDTVGDWFGVSWYTLPGEPW